MALSVPISCFLFLLALLPFSSLISAQSSSPFTGCTCSSDRRRRREVSSLSDGEWNDYIRTFIRLKNTRDGNSLFENAVRSHMRFRDEAHVGEQFLPWHREYLFQTECLLRRFNPGITIPYWDWSADTRDLAVAPVWRRIGGAREASGPRPIPNPPLQNWSSSVAEQHLVTRDFNSGVSGSINDPLESRGTIRQLARDANNSFAEFSRSWELIHNSIHAAIGGDMGAVMTSPNDPVFYLHHAYVDKLWSDYQRLSGKRREYNGRHGSIANVSLSDTTNAWGNVRIEEMFGKDECVSYAPSQRSATGTPPVRQLLRQVQNSRDGETTATPEPEDDAKPGEDVQRSPVFTNAMKNANSEEKEMLMNAPKGRSAPIARRIEKNQYLREVGRRFGMPADVVEQAEKVLTKADNTVKYEEVYKKE